MHFVFIINSLSNQKQVDDLERTVHSLDLKERDKVHFCKTQYSGHAPKIALEYATRYRSDALIIACGGDGTVHEIANALVFGETPMAVMPFGSGNDFARTVLPKEMYDKPQMLLEHLSHFETRPIDLIRVDCYDNASVHIPEISMHCVNIMSFGLDTMINDIAKQIISKTKKKGFIYKNAYNIAILKSFIKGWDYNMRYSFETEAGEDNIEGEIKYSLAGVCNGRYYGKGFNPSPESLVDDGVLEICLVDHVSRTKALPMVKLYKKGLHLDHPKVHMYRVTSGVISPVNSSQMIHGNYDGEHFHAHHVRFEVIPSALPFAFFSI